MRERGREREKEGSTGRTEKVSERAAIVKRVDEGEKSVGRGH